MTAGAFRRVLVPVELEPAKEGELAIDRAVKVNEHKWVAVGPWTVSALKLAARLAREGELWLVHASPNFFDYDTWLPPLRIEELNRSARQDSTAALETIAKRHCPDVQLHTVVEPGRPLDAILETAKAHPPDAIVLAASSRGKVHRAVIGSTVDKVIRQSFCPVVVVPSDTN